MRAFFFAILGGFIGFDFAVHFCFQLSEFTSPLQHCRLSQLYAQKAPIARLT